AERHTTPDINDRGNLPSTQDVRQQAVSFLQPRQFVNHVSSNVMPCFLRQRASIEFWIKEILREKDVAVYERRTQTTSLIGPSFPQRVVNIKSKVVREPPPE